MFYNRFLLAASAAVLLVNTGCNKDTTDDYDVPTTYNFTNVNYSGQTSRLAMLTELSTLVKTANVSGATALDATTLKNMYANQNNPFANAALNTSGKQLKDKTVSTEQANIDAILDAVAAASASTSATAANGTAGIAVSNDGTKSYLLNANGVELAQVIEKGIMGATFYYQATAVYLGSGKMDVDNETVTAGEGTMMEHHWDEAFGYFGVPLDFPTNTTGIVYWGKYCHARNTLLATSGELMNALLKGRAAISNKDLATRDLMIAEVRRIWEKVAVATAISYLNEGKEKLTTDPAVAHHALSEAYAFIWGLKFGGDAGVTSAQVDALLALFATSANPLDANLYSTTTSQIDGVIDALIGYYPALSGVKNDL
jgi:hypothetical protein